MVFLFLFITFCFSFPGHAETLIYDVLKVEWSVIAGPTSSITTNKVSYVDSGLNCSIEV